MKKVILSLTILLAVISLAACSVNSKTGIQFTQLPDAIYEQNVNIDEAGLKELLSQIKVKVDGKEYNLTEKSLVVTGFDANTLKTPGGYTLVVTSGTLSITYNYTVVAPSEPTIIEKGDYEALLTAGQNGGIYQLAGDIEIPGGDPSSTAMWVKKSIVLYGNGYTISTKSAGRLVNVNGNNISVVFYDLNLDNQCPNVTQRGLQIQESSNVSLHLDNVSIENHPEIQWNYNYALNIPNGNSHLDINIKNSKLKGWAAINSFASYSKINVENSTLIGENSSPDHSFGVVVIDGNGKFGDTGINGIQNEINLKNCKFIAKENTNQHQYLVSVQYGAILNTVTLTNCDLTQGKPGYYQYTGVGNKIFVDGELQ